MAMNHKAQKETNQAIRHLRDYVGKSEKWAPNYRDLELQIITPVADQHGLTFETTMERLLNSQYEESVVGYIFEEMVTCHWDNEGSIIDEYQQQRGWREGPHGKRFLRALAVSEIKLYTIVNVLPGEWVDVQPYGKNSQPKRVHERTATVHMEVGDCLAARVLKIGKERNFSGSILPLTPPLAASVMRAVNRVEQLTRDTYQQLLDDKEIDYIDEALLASETQSLQSEALSRMAFRLWVASAFSDSHTAMPIIRNTDDQDIVLTKYRLTIKGHKKAIQKHLDTHFEVMNTNEWAWLNDQQRLIANIRLKQKHIELETNSIERGKQGIEKLQTVLGDLIGNTIGVHETIESAMANHPVKSPVRQEDLRSHPEANAQIQEYLQKHYQDSLDQPIPMLDNRTPRQCAADPETREKAIHWLRDMELHNLKTGQIFDSSGLWEALELTSYR